jgi:hypothetical protein
VRRLLPSDAVTGRPFGLRLCCPRRFGVKGIIFNLLEEAVTEEFGPDAWEKILDDAELEGVYTAVGTYEHDELHKLVDAASALLDKPSDDIQRWFGNKAMPLLATRYKEFFAGHDSAISFVLTLNDVIHPEVRKLFPGAYAPDFEFERIADDTVAIGYLSYRDLCPFAEGLVEGAAKHYGETVEIEQARCKRRGGDKCVLVCRFSGGDGRP